MLYVLDTTISAGRLAELQKECGTFRKSAKPTSEQSAEEWEAEKIAHYLRVAKEEK